MSFSRKILHNGINQWQVATNSSEEPAAFYPEDGDHNLKSDRCENLYVI
jgi:hypothetical protein